MIEVGLIRTLLLNSIKHTLITLIGRPKVSISITPLNKKLLPNMMDIPFLSKFITQSIDAVAREYMAPKSMMLDLQQMLRGDGIKRGERTGMKKYTVLSAS